MPIKMGVWVFIGLMFVGMGIGAIYGREDAGTLIGMGAGFIGWAIADWFERTRSPGGRGKE